MIHVDVQVSPLFAVHDGEQHIVYRGQVDPLSGYTTTVQTMCGIVFVPTDGLFEWSAGPGCDQCETCRTRAGMRAGYEQIDVLRYPNLLPPDDLTDWRACEWFGIIDNADEFTLS